MLARLKKTYIFAALLGSTLAVFANNAMAANLRTEAEITAEFIANYIPYLTWPKNIRTHEDAANICLFDSGGTRTQLAKLKRNYPMNIKEKSKWSSYDDCHVLFVSKQHIDSIDHIIDSTQGKPIVTISDIPDFVKRGGVTGFRIAEKQRLILELNVPALEASRVKIKAALLDVMDKYP